VVRASQAAGAGSARSLSTAADVGGDGDDDAHATPTHR
jgi:hypothetical protein